MPARSPPWPWCHSISPWGQRALLVPRDAPPARASIICCATHEPRGPIESVRNRAPKLTPDGSPPGIEPYGSPRSPPAVPPWLSPAIRQPYCAIHSTRARTRSSIPLSCFAFSLFRSRISSYAWISGGRRRRRRGATVGLRVSSPGIRIGAPPQFVHLIAQVTHLVNPRQGHRFYIVKPPPEPLAEEDRHAP